MKNQKSLVGEVISNKMEKTVIVQVERTVQHPMYGKVVRQRTRLKAHDEKRECRVGDQVRIVECRPISKEKHWRVVEILARKPVVEEISV